MIKAEGVSVIDTPSATNPQTTNERDSTPMSDTFTRELVRAAQSYASRTAMGTTIHAPNEECRKQLLDTFQRMAREVPSTRGDGTPTQQAARFWLGEELCGQYSFGYPHFPDRPAVAYAVTALHQLNGCNRPAALKLLRMAVDELAERA